MTWKKLILMFIMIISTKHSWCIKPSASLPSNEASPAQLAQKRAIRQAQILTSRRVLGKENVITGSMPTSPIDTQEVPETKKPASLCCACLSYAGQLVGNVLNYCTATTSTQD